MKDVFDFDEAGKLDPAGRHGRITRAIENLKSAVERGVPERIERQMVDKILYPPAVYDDP